MSDVALLLQIEDLLSNIGGQLGLFLGLSILTVCELMELVADLGMLFSCKMATVQPSEGHQSETTGTGTDAAWAVADVD